VRGNQLKLSTGRIEVDAMKCKFFDGKIGEKNDRLQHQSHKTLTCWRGRARQSVRYALAAEKTVVVPSVTSQNTCFYLFFDARQVPKFLILTPLSTAIFERCAQTIVEQTMVN